LTHNGRTVEWQHRESMVEINNGDKPVKCRDGFRNLGLPSAGLLNRSLKDICSAGTSR
jgi:hypothetical protein